MKIAFITRSTIFSCPGGDTIQVLRTSEALREQGVLVDIVKTDEPIRHDQYDLFHFFNITRPADILYHLGKADKPFVLTPILIDYSEYDKFHRKGLSGIIFRFLPADSIEYVKTVGRWLFRKDKLISKSYLLQGHRKSIRKILQKAALIFPNSNMEYKELVKRYGIEPHHRIVPNGVDPELFTSDQKIQRDPKLIVCAARIEGLKNQVNLIRALNNTDYKLVLIGSPAPNQKNYYNYCRKLAAGNVSFVEHLPQEQLLPYFQKAKVHILPSWFETCGLSTLEAGISGCNVVATRKGYSEEYLQEYAVYCDPSSPESILQAAQRASACDPQDQLRKKISTQYTWKKAATNIRNGYESVLERTGKLNIAILGTRGIPNYYGGFEQFAEHLSQGLAEKGHRVTVFNAHNHPYQQKTWKNIRIEHAYNPERILGSFGQFIYDFNCILRARKFRPDIILMLGYTSSSVWGWLFPKNSILIFNMDGLEWQRTKYSKSVQRFLLKAEKLAMRSGDVHVADSVVIQSYLKQKYNVACEYIPYGAHIPQCQNESLLNEWGVSKGNYFLMIARIEPENNIESILEGFSESRSAKKFLVVGDTRNKYGRHLLKKFAADERIQFIGPIYNNLSKIHTLRFFSYLYFHGHTVGGTNPSLLEAMAGRALIAAHDNPFNRAILDQDAFYFANPGDVRRIIDHTDRGYHEQRMIQNNLIRIEQNYTWQKIVDDYHNLMLKCLSIKSNLPAEPATEMVVA